MSSSHTDEFWWNETVCLWMTIYTYIYIHQALCSDTSSIFKQSLTGLNLNFSFSWTSCLTKAEELSLSYYLPIAGGRIIGFIPFPRVLVLCEMQSVSSRILTCVAVSISYDDNPYTTYIYIVIYRQTVSIYHNSSVWLDTWDALSWDRNTGDFNVSPIMQHHSHQQS